VSDEQVEVVPEDDSEAVAQANAIKEMNRLHIELARKAATLALQVLEQAEVKDWTVSAAVSLLKLGVDLERKSVLGIEEAGGDGNEPDPFEALLNDLPKPVASPKEG
jgi:hypothetical protein